jgi:phosphoribosylaminoimidazolecarboxamide formyltransferase / IMP cyclohydrolase
VTVIVDPADYTTVLEEFASGETTLMTRKRLAAKVFRHTAAYDALIGDYLTSVVQEEQPETLTKTYTLKQALRYGENSHQRALFYQSALPVPYSIASAEQIHGKELSYNNIKDADAALRIAQEFTAPVAVVLKHMNPCGIGTADTIAAAFQKAFEADPVSIFGGIVVLNRPVDLATAEQLSGIFLEIVIAPAFAADAFSLLAKKKNLRLLTVEFAEAANEPEIVSVLGGLLVQDPDDQMETAADWQVVTHRVPSDEETAALAFAWKAVKHVKSNAIVLANHQQTVGIGAGQMNRVGSVKIAIEQAEASGNIEGAVLASDAFFPMDDCVAYAAEHGIKAIIQPGGSIKDQASIEMADKHGITMVFTGVRHFKH